MAAMQEPFFLGQDKKKIKKEVSKMILDTDIVFLQRWKSDLDNYIGFFIEAKKLYPEKTTDRMIKEYIFLLTKALDFLREEIYHIDPNHPQQGNFTHPIEGVGSSTNNYDELPRSYKDPLDNMHNKRAMNFKRALTTKKDFEIGVELPWRESSLKMLSPNYKLSSECPHIKFGFAIWFLGRCKNIEDIYDMVIKTRNKTGPLDKSFFEHIVPNHPDDDEGVRYEERFLENFPQPKGYDPEVEIFPHNLFNLKAWGNEELSLEGVRFLLWLSFIPEHMKERLFHYESEERKLEKKRNHANLRMVERSGKLPEGSVSSIANYLGGIKNRSRTSNNNKSRKNNDKSRKNNNKSRNTYRKKITVKKDKKSR